MSTFLRKLWRLFWPPARLPVQDPLTTSGCFETLAETYGADETKGAVYATTPLLERLKEKTDEPTR